MKNKSTFAHRYHAQLSILQKLITSFAFCSLLVLSISASFAKNPEKDHRPIARSGIADGPILKPVQPICFGGSPQNAIFFETFESGLGSWAISNYGNTNDSAPWTPRDWTVSAALPDGKAGKAAFAANPTDQDCGDDWAAGVMSITSPVITIPSNAVAPFYTAFDHYFSLKAGFDGGIVEYRIGNGGWSTVPGQAFTDNGYNRALDAYNPYNPLGSVPAFSGPEAANTASGWGQSRINLTTLGLDAGETIQLRWSLGTDEGCNGRIGWYIDDVRVYTCSGAPTVQFLTSATSVNEGEATVARPTPEQCLKYVEKIVTVKINAAPSQPVTITINSAGTATNGKTADYNLTPGTFTLQAGKLSQEVKVRIYNDAYVEGSETAVLTYTLTSPAGGNAVRETFNQQHTVLIADDDFTPGVRSVELLSADFNTNTLPQGWNMVTTGGYGKNWTVFYTNEFSMNNSPFLWANLYDDGNVLDKIVESAPFDSYNMTSINVAYDEIFEPGEFDENVQALVDVWDGSQWRNILTQNLQTGQSGSWSGYGKRNISIPAAFANRSMKVRFRFIAALSSWAIDNVKITGVVTSQAETALTATPAQEYLGPNATVYFYDQATKNLVAKIKNLSSFDYGCTSVSINRAGNLQTNWYDAFNITRKTIKVTPTNDNATGEYEVTLYYRSSELTGSNGAIIRSMGRSKTAIGTGNNDSNSTSESVTSSTLNASQAFTSVFHSGFAVSSGFGLSDATPAKNATQRINSGGESFAATASRVFSADQYFTGTAKISVTTGDIIATTDDELYRSQRLGAAFSYSIPVPNGQISIVLHFAETYWGVPGKGGSAGTGKRKFHVNIEGTRKLTDYDIFVKAGGAMRARTETIPVTITDGVLNLDFLKGSADSPALAAIEILSTQAILAPLADATIRNAPNTAINYGTASTLEIKTGSLPSYARTAYLKFPLAGISQIGSAKLRLYGQNVQNSTNVSLAAFGVSTDSWTETGVTWSNAPASSGAALGSVNVNNLAQYYEIDVTAYVKAQLTSDKIVSLFITNPANQNIQLTFNSKENAANPPQLVITAVAPPTARTGREVELILSESLAEPEASSVYPNPADKHFTVYISKAHEGNVDLQMINLDGNVVQQMNPAAKDSEGRSGSVVKAASRRDLPDQYPVRYI
ncbi:DNRLRE domain-containing protein [Dyadobacter sp. NIV53]|uniref:CBM96 family carbohydrate-binding protein n=1 Tax=Dyadobacter sp. NIV53 TaxID=2861765 RepID=UPI001C8792C1|nr:DNRLRE domain-containing protein [Dyadobacter sp. NIV53]